MVSKFIPHSVAVPPGVSWLLLGSPGSSWGLLAPPGVSWRFLPCHSWGPWLLLGSPGQIFFAVPPGVSWPLLAPWPLLVPLGAPAAEVKTFHLTQTPSIEDLAEQLQSRSSESGIDVLHRFFGDVAISVVQRQGWTAGSRLGVQREQRGDPPELRLFSEETFPQMWGTYCVTLGARDRPMEERIVRCRDGKPQPVSFLLGGVMVPCHTEMTLTTSDDDDSDHDAAMQQMCLVRQPEPELTWTILLDWVISYTEIAFGAGADSDSRVDPSVNARIPQHKLLPGDMQRGAPQIYVFFVNLSWGVLFSLRLVVPLVLPWSSGPLVPWSSGLLGFFISPEGCVFISGWWPLCSPE